MILQVFISPQGRVPFSVNGEVHAFGLDQFSYLIPESLGGHLIVMMWFHLAWKQTSDPEMSF